MPTPLPPPPDRIAAEQRAAALAMLQRSGNRPTPLRLHLLESLLALEAENGGATIDQLYLHLRQRGLPASVPGIYKVLAELVAAQAVARHAVEHGPTIFVVERPEYRTHLVCTCCGKVHGLATSALREQLLAIARAQGFEVEDVAFTLRGRCHACASQPRRAAA
ncbi:Fur family transcriptional regulator [Pseudorhodoferax sp.]|uniref:Fur family transcriptional regulator n=1 Tax=Pseudorhodoferax sp. TaxID=1993553 RepID=UPI0039E302CB